MSENGSDDEQIPMADEDLEENENSNSEISNSVRSAPQEVSNLPVLESLSPRSISQDEPESGNSSQQPSVVGTLLDNDLRYFSWHFPKKLMMYWNFTYRNRANKGRRHYSKIIFLGLRLPHKKDIKNGF